MKTFTGLHTEDSGHSVLDFGKFSLHYFYRPVETPSNTAFVMRHGQMLLALIFNGGADIRYDITGETPGTLRHNEFNLLYLPGGVTCRLQAAADVATFSVHFNVAFMLHFTRFYPVLGNLRYRVDKRVAGFLSPVHHEITPLLLELVAGISDTFCAAPTQDGMVELSTDERIPQLLGDSLNRLGRRRPTRIVGAGFNYEQLSHEAIKRACTLLRDTNMTIQQIAEALGYTLRGFKRLFKKYTHQTPEDYRNKTDGNRDATG